MKHEMTAREFAIQFNRMCNAEKDCTRCPLGKAKGWRLCRDYQITHPEETVSAVEKWAAKHPEETLEQVGDGIYLDPKHRIVADEVTRVYTLELTQVGVSERETGDLMALGQDIANEFAAKAYPYNVDDVRCIRAQQFITKSHEEEV